MKLKNLGWLAVAALAFCGGCGDDEGDGHHGTVTVGITFSADPATAGTAVEIEVEVKEDGEHILADEVHIEVSEVGTTAAPTELTVSAHADHYTATHTFATAGTYDVKAEAHIVDGDHEEQYEATQQLVVQ